MAKRRRNRDCIHSYLGDRSRAYMSEPLPVPITTERVQNGQNGISDTLLGQLRERYERSFAQRRQTILVRKVPWSRYCTTISECWPCRFSILESKYKSWLEFLAGYQPDRTKPFTLLLIFNASRPPSFSKISSHSLWSKSSHSSPAPFGSSPLKLQPLQLQSPDRLTVSSNARPSSHD